MPCYRDPRAPQHRVVFGGVEFVDQVTADIDPSPETLALFAGAGIVELQPEAKPDEPAPLDADPDPVPRAPARTRTRKPKG